MCFYAVTLVRGLARLLNFRYGKNWIWIKKPSLTSPSDKKSPRKIIRFTPNLGAFAIYKSGYYYFYKYPVLVKLLVSATSNYKFYNLLPIINNISPHRFTE